MKRASVVWLLAGLWLAARQAEALSFGFQDITHESATDAAIGEAQLYVDVTSVVGDPRKVQFAFHNRGPLASSITDGYFDDSLHALLSMDSITGSPGVQFSRLATPQELPGGHTIGFHTTAGFSADSDPPVEPNGVNPGETLWIVYDLQTGMTLDDVTAQMLSSALRVGIHAQGFASEGSESFVTHTPVPEPDGLALLGLSLAATAWLRRRVG